MASGVVMDATVELTVLTLSTEDVDLKVDFLSDFTVVVDDRVVVDVVDDVDCVACSRFVNAA